MVNSKLILVLCGEKDRNETTARQMGYASIVLRNLSPAMLRSALNDPSLS